MREVNLGQSFQKLIRNGFAFGFARPQDFKVRASDSLQQSGLGGDALLTIEDVWYLRYCFPKTPCPVLTRIDIRRSGAGNSRLVQKQSGVNGVEVVQLHPCLGVPIHTTVVQHLYVCEHLSLSEAMGKDVDRVGLIERLRLTGRYSFLQVIEVVG